MESETETEEEVVYEVASPVEVVPYYKRVLAGEIPGPPFQHVSEDGTFTDYTFDEVMASTKSDLEKALWLKVRIDAMKRELSDSDYIAIKLAEGVATADEYSEQIATRASLRETINTYQNTIDSLGVEV